MLTIEHKCVIMSTNHQKRRENTVDNQENGNMPSDEQVRAIEEVLMDALPDAENGDEEKRKFLNELSTDMFAYISVNVCTKFSLSFVFRLAEYYCLSFETVEKAVMISIGLVKTVERWICSEEVDTQKIVKFCEFVPYFQQIAKLTNTYDQLYDTDREEWREKVRSRARAVIAIEKIAKDGYALAQYWMGYFAEKDHDCPDDEDENVDYRVRAMKWYRKSLEQGFVPAQKRLAAVEEQIQEESCMRRRISGKCQHCGGSFKGLFKKVCASCGKPKDY